MKAIVRKELVLLYRLEEETEKGKKVREILQGLGMPVRTLLPEMLGWTVGACAGLPGYSQGPQGDLPSEAWEEEAMILQGLTRQRLDQLLRTMREKGAPAVALKAVVTQYNQDWTAYRLIKEIARERDEMVRLRASRKTENSGQNG